MAAPLATQAPATPKWKRALLLGAAYASPDLAARLSPSTSERHAIEARRRKLSPPVSPEVVFLVPLVGPHHVSDWAAVSERAVATLESFRRQTDGAWRAIVCGQTKPDGFPDDARIIWHPFTESVEGNDKWRKFAALSMALSTLGAQHGYAMPFDADDLLAPHVVAEMRQRRAPGGYVVDRGYVYDASTGGWAETAPQSLSAPRQKAFWKLCGSSAAFAFDTAHGAQDAAMIGAFTAHEHRMFPYLARLAGRPLTPLAPGAALYILNHGENFGARRGRVSFKSRYVARFALPEGPGTAKLAQTFALAPSD